LAIDEIILTLEVILVVEVQVKHGYEHFVSEKTWNTHNINEVNRINFMLTLLC